MTATQPPTWPPSSCPAWCSRDHRGDDHSEDRIHETEPLALAASVRTSLLPEHLPASVELQVQLRQGVDDTEPWVEVRATEPGLVALTMTAWTARHLAECLSATVATT